MGSMSKRQSDSQKRFAYASRLFAEGSGSGDLPTEIQVIPCGEWNHPFYGPMKIAPSDIKEMKNNFDSGVRLDLPITAGHDNGMSGGELPAVAWYKEVHDRGKDGLWATVEWNEKGEAHLKGKEYKYFSSEFFDTYANPTDGKIYKNVLCGGALTNKPFFKELEPVGTFSETGIMSFTFNASMNLKDILAKDVKTLSEAEKTFLREHKEELNDEQKSAFASVFDEGDGGGEGGGEEGGDQGGDEGGEDGGEGGAGGNQITASEVKISASELAALRAQANEGAKAFAEVEKMKLGEEVGRLVFSATNADGRIKPGQKTAVVELMFSLNAKQRDQFRNILSNLPKADKSIFDEIGDGGAPEQTKEAIAAQVKGLANEKVKASEGKLSYAAAVQQVYAEKPELQKAYNDALAAEAK